MSRELASGEGSSPVSAADKVVAKVNQGELVSE